MWPLTFGVTEKLEICFASEEKTEASFSKSLKTNKVYVVLSEKAPSILLLLLLKDNNRLLKSIHWAREEPLPKMQCNQGE